VASRVRRVRLLYLYPSDLTDGLIDVIGATGVPYYDLSLQHSSAPLLKRMRRWGNGDKFLARIDDIRARYPDATIRSNFIVGYPGETEADHDNLLAFMAAAQFDWVGLFAYSREEGTYADTQDGHIDASLIKERLSEASELQDGITRSRRAALVGTTQEVLVDEARVGRSHREAPEIDGVVRVPEHLPVGTFQTVTVTGVQGVDLEAS
jgi:ribosomal protein S12 methylthiotransferase